MRYLLYFIYLARNWNLSIALHVLKQDLKGRRKYHINTSGVDRLKQLENAGVDLSHASFYMPASYDLLELTFNFLKDKNICHLTDMGCGKGRALCVAAHYGIPQLTGIDISEDLLRYAEQNLQQTIKKVHPIPKYKLLLRDAFYFPIANNCDVVFLYNPFDEIILSGVLNHISESLEKHPRAFYLIYITPLNHTMIIDAGFKQVFYHKIKEFLEVSIYLYKK